MLVVANTKDLLAAMAAPMAVAPTGGPKDVLKYVKLQAESGKLSITGADGEVMATVSMDVEVVHDGAALIQPSKLASVLRESRTETVKIEANESTVTIKAGGTFKLVSESVDDFPAFGAVEPQVTILADPGSLAEGISRTAFCVDVQSTRYAMGGVLFDVEDGLHLAATDSRRLAVATVSGTVSGKATSGLIVPAKALLAVGKVLGDEEVELEFNDRAMVARSGGLALHSRLVEGRFPAWRGVIPAASEYELTLSVAELSSALRQSQVTTNVETRGVGFRFTADGACIESQAADVGRSTIGLDAAIEAPGFDVDPRFMLEMLNRLPKTGEVSMQWTSDTGPVLLSFEGYRYIVMPISRD